MAINNILCGLALVAFAIYCWQARPQLDSSYRPVVKAIGIFFLLLLVSALCSGQIGRGLATWANLALWRFVPFAMVVWGISRAKEAENILACAFMGTTISSCYCIYQGLQGMERANGFFGHPMTYAGWSCVILPAMLVCLLDKSIFIGKKWQLAVALVLGCAGLIFNGTRGAWIAVAPMMGIIFAYYGRQSKRVIALALIAVVALGAVYATSPKFVERVHSITNTADPSNNVRLNIWQDSAKMFLDHKALGVGLGQYDKKLHEKYIGPETWRELHHAHNNFIHMLAENGLVGCVGFMLCLGALVWTGIKAIAHSGNPYGLILSTSVFSLWAIQGLTEYNFGNSAVMKMFWLVVGCAVVLARCWREKSRD